MKKIINENQGNKIDILIKDDEIIISGLEMKPFWKRILLVIFWWKSPEFIIRNPRIIYNRKSKGELVALVG